MPRAFRKFLISALWVGLLLPMAATIDVRPAAAAGSCTGWGSTTVPPATIRVGRADGSVETVDFRRYVGVVMAKEWPSWMPVAALEAGATAVKQYGWWYTLAGKHRSAYVNPAGHCFDVRDTTSDQLYRPEKVSVTAKIWRAVDATLGLSVRKAGKFFLTGYRAGSSSVCASDVDGTKLFAKSVIACAEKGWSREQIQTAYYAPNVTFHWAGAAPPALADVNVAISPPHVSLRTGMTLRQKHARVYWDEEGARPAGSTYQLQRLVNGRWSNVALTDATKPSLVLNIERGQTHRFRVRLRDAAGQVGQWYAGPRFAARMAQDSGAGFAWSTGWHRLSTTAAAGGTVTHASAKGSHASLSFNGRAAAVVGTRGPGRGVARIFVDGTLEAEVDLQATTTKWRTLLFTREWSGSETHTIRIEVVGTSGRPRVEVDGILIYR